MAVIFATLYTNAAAFADDRFASPCDRALTDDLLSPFYFSVVTLTTIGYGDFRPTKALSKILVCFEVFIGLLLIVLVIARLISLISGSNPEDGSTRGHRGPPTSP
jgi:hypothetical protein